jgi:hypothetical protein
MKTPLSGHLAGIRQFVLEFHKSFPLHWVGPVSTLHNPFSAFVFLARLLLFWHRTLMPNFVRPKTYSLILSPGAQQATCLHMSKECTDRLSTTKPQRSVFQRFIHSSLFRSCWAINQQPIAEPTASISLLVQDTSTNYQSNDVQTASCSNQVTTIKNHKQLTIFRRPSTI